MVRLGPVKGGGDRLSLHGHFMNGATSEIHKLLRVVINKPRGIGCGWMTRVCVANGVTAPELHGQRIGESADRFIDDASGERPVASSGKPPVPLSEWQPHFELDVRLFGWPDYSRDSTKGWEVADDPRCKVGWNGHCYRAGGFFLSKSDRCIGQVQRCEASARRGRIVRSSHRRHRYDYHRECDRAKRQTERACCVSCKNPRHGSIPLWTGSIGAQRQSPVPPSNSLLRDVKLTYTLVLRLRQLENQLVLR